MRKGKVVKFIQLFTYIFLLHQQANAMKELEEFVHPSSCLVNVMSRAKLTCSSGEE